MKRCLLAATAFLPLLLWGEIYRSIDDRGNPVFSDQPGKNAVPIDVKEPNTTPAVDVPRRRTPAPAAVSEDIPELTLTQPADGQILANGLLGTSASVSLSKSLPPEYRLRFALDGRELQTGRSTRLTISRLERGPHRITVSLLDTENAVVRQDSVEIMVYWPNN